MNDEVPAAASYVGQGRARAHLFLITFLGFGFQVLLLRVFHLFFYDASSINMLAITFFGLGLGVMAAGRGRGGLGVACLTLLVYGLSCLLFINQAWSIACAFFFFLNLGVALANSSVRLKAVDFYLFDILGGATGALAGFFLPHLFSIEAAFMLLLTTGFASLGGRRAVIGSVLTGAASVVLIGFPGMDLTAYGASFKNPFERKDPEINAQKKLRHGGAQRVFTGWSSVGKVDALETSGPEPHLLFYSSNRIWFSFPKMANATPVGRSNSRRALVIGSGGGLEVRLLLSLGYAVTALEVNEVTFRLMKEEFRVASGDFVGQVTYLNQEGRNYLATDPQSYDLIFITNIGTNGGPAGAGDDLTANMLFTREAFESYYQHLRPGGFVVSTNNYADELSIQSGVLRELETSRATLLAHGEKPESNIWVFGQARHYDVQDHRRNKSLVFHRRGPAAVDEFRIITQIQQHMKEGGRLIFSPVANVPAEANPVNPVEVVAREIPRASQIDRLWKEHGQNIRPTTDATPYFYSTSRNPMVPIKASLYLIFAGLICFGRVGARGRAALILGIVGALLEVSLMNGLALYFPSVVFAFTLVTTAFLFGSTAAAALAHQRPSWRPEWFLLAVAFLTALIWFLIFDKRFIFALSLAAMRGAVVLAIVALLALASSVPFVKLLVEGRRVGAVDFRWLLALNFLGWGLGSELARDVNVTVGHDLNFVLVIGAALLIAGLWIKKRPPLSAGVY